MLSLNRAHQKVQSTSKTAFLQRASPTTHLLDANCCCFIVCTLRGQIQSDAGAAATACARMRRRINSPSMTRTAAALNIWVAPYEVQEASRLSFGFLLNTCHALAVTRRRQRSLVIAHQRSAPSRTISTARHTPPRSNCAALRRWASRTFGI